MTKELIIFACGEVDGEILTLYDKVLTLEKEYGVICDWVVCTGSMGIWPHSKFLDRGTRKNTDEGDFAKLYFNKWEAPRQTLFVAGAHEDHLWLDWQYQNKNTEVISNMHWLVNGYKTSIGPTVLGLGKVYSPKSYIGKTLNKKKHRHYNREEVQKATSQGHVDLFLSHQGPKDEQFGPIKSQSEGIKNIVYATRPTLMIHGGYNFHKEYELYGSKILSLAKGEILPLVYSNKLFSKLL